MDQDSGSEGDSLTLDAERDVVVVYDSRSSPHPNHVSKVMINSSDPNTAVVNAAIVTNDAVIETVNLDVANHEYVSHFRNQLEEPVRLEATGKPYQNLADALAHFEARRCLRESQFQKTALHELASPSLSHNSNDRDQEEVKRPTNNPLLPTPGTLELMSPPDLVHNVTVSPKECLMPPNTPKLADVPSGSAVPLALTNPTESPASVSPNDGCSAEGCSENDHSPDVIIGTSSTTEAAPMSAKTDVSCADSSDIPDQMVPPTSVSQSVITLSQDQILPTIPDALEPIQGHSDTSSPKMDVIKPVKESNCPAVKPVVPAIQDQNSIQPARSSLSDQQAPSDQAVMKSSEETPFVQKSANSAKSESGFYFPEPVQPAPLVCVPVKEVKFEDLPNHQEVTAKDRFVEKIGEIVPIMVQSTLALSHNLRKSEDDSTVVVVPNYSCQFLPKPKDETTAAQTVATQVLSESKMSNHKAQEEAPSGLAGQDPPEHSYGIIGNEDNLSEITLPPVAEAGMSHHDQDGVSATNGIPRHRIRISIDHRPATPSRRTMVITVLLVVVLISVVSVFGVYKVMLNRHPES